MRLFRIADHVTPARVLAEHVERAASYGRAARNTRTRLEYARDWAHSTHYDKSVGITAFAPEAQAVAAYLASPIRRSEATTIQRPATVIAL